MKKSKVFASLLAILGFQMQSCKDDEHHGFGNYEEVEYGCPYTVFRAYGSVQDENGNGIQDAEVKISIDEIIERQDSTATVRDTIFHSDRTVISEKNGKYDAKLGTADAFVDEVFSYEIITNKDGYVSDTTRKEVRIKDFKYENTGEWETTINNEENIVLKKK